MLFVAASERGVRVTADPRVLHLPGMLANSSPRPGGAIRGFACSLSLIHESALPAHHETDPPPPRGLTRACGVRYSRAPAPNAGLQGPKAGESRESARRRAEMSFSLPPSERCVVLPIRARFLAVSSGARRDLVPPRGSLRGALASSAPSAIL